jgi:hypothetical protein
MAPDESVTVPVIPPSVCCAFAKGIDKDTSARKILKINAERLICNFMDIPPQKIKFQQLPKGLDRGAPTLFPLVACTLDPSIQSKKRTTNPLTPKAHSFDNRYPLIEFQFWPLCMQPVFPIWTYNPRIMRFFSLKRNKPATTACMQDFHPVQVWSQPHRRWNRSDQIPDSCGWRRYYEACCRDKHEL